MKRKKRKNASIFLCLFLPNIDPCLEELQLLAEEEAETICELEKENYKLKNTLMNIEDRFEF